jgi:zinc protease
MKQTFFAGFLCVTSLLATTASVAAAAAPPAVPLAHQASDLQPDADVTWGTLKNGLRYAILPNATPQGRASVRLGIMTGSLQETEAQRGLAHFIEHLAFNGSAHFPPGTLVEYFQRLGMNVGGDVNASTEFDRTQYQLELPDTKPQTFERAFTLLADYAGGLLLERQSIDKERGIILSEMRDRDSQEQRAWVAQMKFLAPGARFTDRLAIGTDQVIRTAQREQVLDYYDRWYRPELMVAVVVGDFDPKAVEAQLVAALAPLEARVPASVSPDLGEIRIPERTAAYFHHQPEASTASVVVNVVLPPRNVPDTLERRLSELRVGIAQDMVNRRLALLANEPDTDIAGGQMQVNQMFKQLRVASMGVGCRTSEQWQACIATAEREIRRALEFGFEPAEFEATLADVRNQLEQSASTVGSWPSADRAQALIGSILDEAVFTHPASDRALLLPLLEKITLAECEAELRALWSKGAARQLFVSGNLQLDEKAILAAWAASAAQPVAQRMATASTQFAYADSNEAGAEEELREIEDIDVTQVKFVNGVRLNLKRTDFEAQRIYVNVRVGGGLLGAPRNKPGLPLLASRTLIAAGLGKHSAAELDTLLAGRNVSVDFNVGADALVFQSATTPADLLLQLQLLRAQLTDPGYRPEVLRRFRQGIERTYTELSHSIDGPRLTEIPRLMTNGDPRFGWPDRSSVLRRDFAELRQWLGPQFASGPLEISLVGDIDVEQATALVARTFGTLPAREPKPGYAAERQVVFPKKPLDKRFTIATELSRGLVDIRWPAMDGSDVRRARGLQVLTNIFSDRLRVQLREQMGQAYNPSVAQELSDTFRDYGFIVADASVAPGQAATVAKVIHAVAADLAANGVTEDELVRAKTPLLGHLQESLRQNGYWLEVIAGAQEFPRQILMHRSRRQDYEAVSAEELKMLARQYLAARRASQFVMVPKVVRISAAPDSK